MRSYIIRTWIWYPHNARDIIQYLVVVIIYNPTIRIEVLLQPNNSKNETIVDNRNELGLTARRCVKLIFFIMSYNYVRNYSTTNEQLLFINYRYTFCETTGNARVQNRTGKQQNENCLTFLYSWRSWSRPTTRSQIPNLVNSRTPLWPRSKKLRGERTKSGAEIMTSQDGCRCELWRHVWQTFH